MIIEDLSSPCYEHQSDQALISVKGRLRKAIQSWIDIQTSQYILDVINCGYKLPLLDLPASFVGKNNKSALREFIFVEDSISDLLNLGCINEVYYPPDIINPLSVSIQKSGKKRLILDLRHVNKYIYKNKFRCEDLTVAKEILHPGDFMFTFDLKSGYHHVDIFQDHRKFLSFAWVFSDGRTRYFQFSVLPFGLSSAPYLFTKLLKPLVKKWRSQGVTILVYLDDGLGAASDYHKAKIISLQIHADLLKFGFLPNEQKSHWDPTQTVTYLGTIINTSTCSIAATDKRINGLQKDLDDILSSGAFSVHVKSIAATCGRIISLGNCVGNVTRLMTRNLFAIINSRASWNSFISLTPQALSELKFWNVNIGHLNGIPLWPVQTKPSKVIYSDASSSGCGSIIDIDGKVSHQNWSDFEKAQSSTYRELLAVFLSLKAFQVVLKSQLVLWYTDNKSIVSIINHGSKVPLLQEIALDIHQICLLHAISLDMQWIPRDLNTRADEVSRIIDFDDYSIHDGVFYDLDALWGPHNFDRFACHYNAKLPLFNSKFYQPGSSGVNAFSQDWSNYNNWLCPPAYLTTKVIKHLKICSAKGTLIVPMWKSAHFWPILCPDGVHLNDFIHDWRVLPQIPNLFIRGKAKNCIFGSKPLSFVVLALRIDFGIPPRMILELTDFATG